MCKKFLLIAYTPLQLINCIEFYCKYGHIGVDEISFWLVSHPDNIDKLFELAVKLNNFGAVINKFEDLSIQKDSLLNVFVSRVLLRRLAASFLQYNYDYLVHSSVDKTFVRYISDKGVFKNKVIVDDGLATFIFLNKKSSELKDKKSIKCLVGSILKGLESFVYGFPSKYKLCKYILFTNFRGPREALFSKVLRNDFLELQKKFKSSNLVVKELVHFLGQPLSELGIVSEKDYIQTLVGINSRFSRLEYYPHPSESSSKLKILSEHGITVISGVYGYEVFILQSDFFPGAIHTFYSSAVVVLSRILSETDINVSALVLSSELGFNDISGNINLRRIYDNLSNLGVVIKYKI